MAVAGKVAITLSTENGGAWSADVTYDRLVAVKHNNNLYISRKTVANVEPPNDEFWFLALEGFGGEDVEALIDRMNELSDLIQAIIDGTTQVGNAKTLDGHGASDFSLSKDFFRGPHYAYMECEANDVLYRLQVQENGVALYESKDNGLSWNGLGIATLLDLANYLTKTNGTAIHAINILEDETGTKPSTIVMTTNNGVSFLINADTDGVRRQIAVLPRSQADKNHCLSFNTSESGNWETFSVLHTGNKPTGSYTGNGDATTRTIATGGAGSCIMVRKGGERGIFAIVTESGYFAKDGSHGSDVYFSNGVLTIASTSDAFNTNGATYWYQVL